VWLSKRVSK